MRCVRNKRGIRSGDLALLGLTCLLFNCSGDGQKMVEAEISYSKTNPACMECHARIENIHDAVDIACTDCHGGDFTSTQKAVAHVEPSLPALPPEATPPLDYDLPYQRFVNPSNLRVVRETCGKCHVEHVDNVMKSMMATAAGHHAGGLYLANVTQSKTPDYGTFAVSDDDGDVPLEKGAVRSLADLLTYDPSGDPALFATHYAAVPGQACSRCHLWTRGDGYRGAENEEGIYRADGCAACHMLYSNAGKSVSADTSINHQQTGHPLVHKITRKIPTEQCVHCHHRGARIGLSFTGRSQMPPRVPSGPGKEGTTDVLFNGSFHYADPEVNPTDIHGERGMHCIDCHTQAGVMGDGNIYGHMDEATKIECRTCHGLPGQESTLIDNDGKPMTNVKKADNGLTVLTSKVDGRVHVVPQVSEITNPESMRYNPKAARAMNANHIKEEGGLECYSCHSSWTANCFGCHFERDERIPGLNLNTGLEEEGEASTNNKMFVSFRHFAIGKNSEGRLAPYVVGCQPMAEVTSPDGSILLDFVMPETVNGKSGLALNPVQPHTVRSRGEVRDCVECHRAPPTLGLGSGNYSIARDYAYTAGSNGINVVNRWDDPEQPVLVKVLPAGRPLALAVHANVVTGKADFLFCASGPAGLFVFDLRAGLPRAPLAVLSNIDAIDVSYAARYLYVVVREVGLQIYDVLDPAHPVAISTLALPGALRAEPWGVDLFVAAGSNGLAVVDIADHRLPSIRGRVTGIEAVAVTLYAHFQNGSKFAVRAYVADPSFGVRIVDLLPDYDNPRLVQSLPILGAVALDTYTRYLVEDDEPSREHDYLYVAAGRNGLRVFDITEPDKVFIAASRPFLPGAVMDVDVSSHPEPPGVDDYALLAIDPAGILVMDVNDPTLPQVRGLVEMPGAIRTLVDVQQLDRFLDEQGVELKENSHPGAGHLSREEIIRILRARIDE